MDNQKQLLASIIVNLARNAGTSGSRYTYMNAAKLVTVMTDGEFKKHVKKNDWEDIKGFGPSLTESINQFIVKGKVTKTINTPSGRKARLTIKPGIMLDDGSPRRRKKVSRTEYKKLASTLSRLFKKEGIKYDLVGSWRRKVSQIANLDIIIDNKRSVEKVVALLDAYPKFKVKVLSFKEDRLSAKIKYEDSTLNVTITLADLRSWGAYLLSYTGSPNFIIFIRTFAKGEGYILKEDGLYKDTKKIAGKTEEAIFKKLKIEYIKPNKRNYD